MALSKETASAVGENTDLELRLREAIRARLGERRPVSLARVARAIALSTRSVQRHLNALGTTYARVLREERMRLVATLGHERAPRELVADALGYKSTRSVDRLHARRGAQSQAGTLEASLPTPYRS